MQPPHTTLYALSPRVQNSVHCRIELCHMHSITFSHAYIHSSPSTQRASSHVCSASLVVLTLLCLLATYLFRTLIIHLVDHHPVDVKCISTQKVIILHGCTTGVVKFLIILRTPYFFWENRSSLKYGYNTK